ncbi:hypothetical protein KSP39_PZI001441 [Platanthera zijinensis]|uniref:Uncharacterized protein n=1 Tax=Platanthera zijinensis TaxID=2320716 RepID=A0AAP0C2H3_9ASPA
MVVMRNSSRRSAGQAGRSAGGLAAGPVESREDSIDQEDQPHRLGRRPQRPGRGPLERQPQRGEETAATRNRPQRRNSEQKKVGRMNPHGHDANTSGQTGHDQSGSSDANPKPEPSFSSNWPVGLASILGQHTPFSQLLLPPSSPKQTDTWSACFGARGALVGKEHAESLLEESALGAYWMRAR